MMWSLTPLFGVILGTILICLVLLALVWFPKTGQPGERYTCPFIVFLRGGFFAAFTYFGFLLLDCVVKVGFLGIIGYTNINYMLAPVLLSAILGILLIVGSAFVAPTWRSLVVFGAALGYFIYAIEIVAARDNIPEKEAFYTPFIPIVAVQLVVMVIGIIMNLIRKKPALDGTPLWDISVKFKHIMNPKTLIVLWVLFCTELILEFEGLSVFMWI